MSNEDFSSIYDRACAYPFVSDDMFAQSSLVDVASGLILPVGDAVRITQAATARTLPGSDKHLPGYNLDFSSGQTLPDRIAVMAIGSNSSPDVLIKKFRDAAVGGEFFLAQASIENHSVVHGAFIGAAGTIPATLVPQPGAFTSVTVSFLTPEQADILTGTEPNYDLVKTSAALKTRGLSNDPVIAPGTLAYVSPWRSLSLNGIKPLAVQAIPSETSLTKMSSAEAMDLVATYLQAAKPTREFFDTLDLCVEARLAASYRLQPGSVIARIGGEQIRQASISIEAARRGLPPPSLEYHK